QRDSVPPQLSPPILHHLHGRSTELSLKKRKRRMKRKSGANILYRTKKSGNHWHFMNHTRHSAKNLL
ncbi:MAG: hypothetical protein WCY57_05800, partial [Micavibrio sp.]